MKLYKSALAFVSLLLFTTASIYAIDKVTLSEGDVAPDFTLEGSDGNEYTLSEVLKDGPVVLAWFPKAHTTGCTMQCKDMAENGHLLKEYKVSYFMISVDPIEDNISFAEKYNADFAILSDETKQTAHNYGVMSDWGFSNRHTFYIDTDGKILKIDRKVNVASSVKDMVANLDQLEVAKKEAS